MTAPVCYGKQYSPSNQNCIHQCQWVNGCAISKGFCPPNPNLQHNPQLQPGVPPPPQYFQPAPNPSMPTNAPGGFAVPQMTTVANQMQQAVGTNIARTNFIPMPMPRITRPQEGETTLTRFGKNVLMGGVEMIVATGYLWLTQLEL